MFAGKGLLAVAGFAMLTLAACGGGEPRLLNLKDNGNGPDEFAILPPKALELPQNFTELPEPAANGISRTDPTPEEDAIAALGGRPGSNAGIAARDNGLLNHASRFGRTGAIRTELAAEDLQFRRDNDGLFLERIFSANVYFRAYKEQSLDQHAELERWRRAGVRNVSAPPSE
jgi:hypothetical protein